MNVDDSNARMGHRAAFIRDEPLWRTALLYLFIYSGCHYAWDTFLSAWRRGAIVSFLVGAAISCGAALALAAISRADARRRDKQPTSPAV